MILPERVFGRSAAKMMSSGRAIAPIFLTTCSFSSSIRRLGRRDAFLQRHERRDRLPLDLVRPADDRGFGHARMIDERALDFHRADAMSGHVQHVVDAAEQPEVAVGVALGAVAGEVDAGRPPVPVLLHVALGIAVDAAQHRRPRARQRQQPAAAPSNVLAPARVLISARDAGKRLASPSLAWSS